MSKRRWAKTFLFALPAALLLYLWPRRQPEAPLRVGDPALNFSLMDLNDRPVRLDDYRGDVVVVNFWATWCPPCVEEAPSLEKFANRMRKSGVAVIGVSVDQDAAELGKFLTGHRLTFPIARDPSQALASRYGTSKFPETYIIDRGGKVAEKIIGPLDWEDPRISSFVEGLARPGRHPPD